MELILNDEFLDEYHIKEISDYNSNYYKLPFAIKIETEDEYNICDILYIECDEFSNEYCYILGSLDKDNNFNEGVHIAPSPSFRDSYNLDFNDINKEMIWY